MSAEVPRPDVLTTALQHDRRESLDDLVPLEHDLSDVVLVGHSIAGSFIAKAAEQVPELVKRLVFQSAFVAFSAAGLAAGLIAAFMVARRAPLKTVVVGSPASPVH